MGSSNNNQFQAGITSLHIDYELTIPVGTNFSVQQNQYALMRLAFVTFILTTDANAGNRIVRLGIEKAGTFIPFSANMSFQGSSTSYRYFAYAGCGQTPVGAVTSFALCIPDLFFIMREDYIQSSITNIQVGDQITELALFFDVKPSIKEL